MIINFIFPYNTWGGAFRSTYELSNRLILKGHTVRIYYPIIPFFEGNSIFSFSAVFTFLKGLLRSFYRRNKVPWFDVAAETKSPLLINNFFIEDADVIIANHWMTAKSVFRLSPSKGKKFYFIRDIEDWADYFKCEIEAFKLPMQRLVVSEWVGNYLKHKLGLEVSAIVNNGINFDSFSSENKSPNDNICLGFLYAKHPMKGSEYGFRVLNMIKLKYPNVKILIFGFPKKPKLNFDFTYIHRPTGDILKSVYNQIDIFLFTSTQEGWGNPPLEAMVSECAVVTTNVGCVSARIIHNVTGIVCPPGDVDKLINGVEELILSKDKRVEMGRAAKKFLVPFNWDMAADDFVKAIACN